MTRPYDVPRLSFRGGEARGAPFGGAFPLLTAAEGLGDTGGEPGVPDVGPAAAGRLRGLDELARLALVLRLLDQLLLAGVVEVVEVEVVHVNFLWCRRPAFPA